jgi:hypothetical protein
MQNNLQVQQEWFKKELSRRHNAEHRIPHHAGFEYAIQLGGKSMLENLRESSIRRFNFSFPSGATNAPSVSITNVQNQANEADRRYRKQEETPQDPGIKQPRNDSNIQPKLHSTSTFSSSISPSPRRRNRHNAIFGAHLPNAFNSPALAAKVFGPRAALNEEREICREILFHNNTDTTSMNNNNNKNNNAHTYDNTSSRLPSLAEQYQGNDEIDDDPYDALFAEIDVDELVAQKLNQQQQVPVHAACALPNVPSSARNQYPNSSTTRSHSVAPSTSIYNYKTSNTLAYEDDSMGVTSESYRYFPKQQNATHTNSEFHQHNSNTMSKPMSSYSGADTFSTLHDNVPFCQAHNQPCICLTANTPANQGRQFYKCSVMPESEKCGFFQWKDDQPTTCSSATFRNDLQPLSGDIKDIYAENRRKFGHHSFRPGQQEVIERAVRGQDVFVLMPTGGGKSLCYQLPAWCSPGFSVIFSPLLSLIQDQVQSLTKLGVESVFLNSQQDYDTETRHIMDRLYRTPAHGGIKLLYITPEKLSRSESIKSLFKKLSDRGCISRFVVDLSLAFEYSYQDTHITYFFVLFCFVFCS